MRERPILMSAPMVRALLAGTKTQTRRIASKPVRHPDFGNLYTIGALMMGPEPKHVIERACPYGQPGDRLWVRETFAIVPRTAYRCSDGVQQTLRPDDDHDAAIYRAGWDRSNGGLRWRPSIHMPRWASRITLEVTDVRVERLQDISADDAHDEGTAEWAAQTQRAGNKWPNIVRAYRGLWESINGPGSWDANPWVWVVEFKRTDGGGNG